MKTIKNFYFLRFFGLLFFISCGTYIKAQVIYVDLDASGAKDGSSWADAYTDLQEALAAAGSGNSIWVAQGTYFPTPTINDRSATFQLKNGVGIYGGFNGTQNMLEQRNWSVNTTTLSGDINQSGMFPGNSYSVVTGLSVDNTAILDGFVITMGNADAPLPALIPERNGGGLYIESGSPQIANCVFQLNFAVSDGGGVCNNESSGTFSNCQFLENGAENGGGAMANVFNSNPAVMDCSFSENQAMNWGGAVYNRDESSPLFENCIFEENSANFGGAIMNWELSNATLDRCHFQSNSATTWAGAVYNFNSSDALISNSKFIGNDAGTDGGAVVNHNGSNATIVNCLFHSNSGERGSAIFNNDNANAIILNTTIANNTSSNDQGAIHNLNQANATIKNCIIWNNGTEIIDDFSTPVVSYSIVEGGFAGMGNLDENPLFVDSASGNYSLDNCSPGINGGDPDTTGLDLPSLDLANNPRMVMDTIDMGAFEYQSIPCVSCPAGSVVYVIDGGAGTEDGSSWTNAMPFLQDAIYTADYCVNISEIWVAEGTYYPDEGIIPVDDDRNSTFRLRNMLAIIGGFAGTETQISERDWVSNATILSGDINQTDSLDGNSYTVVTGSGTNNTAVIDGFTITGGNADLNSGLFSNPNLSGGGMYNSDGSPTIINCTFSGNSTIKFGGGMYNFDNSSPTITNCTFSGNTAKIGGGMYNRNSSSPMVTNCTFSGNAANKDGGGMYNLDNSSPTVTNCTFSGNTANVEGGGMFNFDNSSPTVTNCTFSGNEANYGGGMSNAIFSSPTVTNWTFSGNAANKHGGGMSNAVFSSPTVTNSTFSENSANFNGGGMYNFVSSPTITNSIFSGNEAGTNGGGMYNWDNSSPQY